MHEILRSDGFCFDFDLLIYCIGDADTATAAAAAGAVVASIALPMNVCVRTVRACVRVARQTPNMVENVTTFHLNSRYIL